MGRSTGFSIAIILILLQAGCQNRFGQCGSFGGCLRPDCSPTIPPPATGSLNIRGGLANQNYYTPQSGIGVPGAASPNSTANWNGMPGTSLAGIGFPATQPVMGGTFSPVQPTQPMAWQVSGVSQIVSPDFATTRINEQFDPSRRPLADASAVRGPTGWNQMPNANRMASASMPTMNNPGFFIPNAAQPNQQFPQGNTQWNWSVNGPSAQPFNQPQQQVLAQASTRDLSNDPNYMAGWRDRGTPPANGTISR